MKNCIQYLGVLLLINLAGIAKGGVTYESFFGRNMELLNPGIAGDFTHVPFYYDPRDKYYYDEDKYGSFSTEKSIQFFGDIGKRQNILSWIDQYGKVIYTVNLGEHIEELLYEFRLDTNAQLKVQHDSNSFYNYLRFRPELYTYVIYAKQIEHYIEAAASFHWNNQKQRKESYFRNLKVLLKKGEVLYRNTSDTFLKNRYGYQMAVLARYTNQYRRVETIIEEYLAPLNIKNHLYYWALHHNAYALHKLNEPAKANYYAVKAFVNAPSKRIRCWLYFNPADQFVKPLIQRYNTKSTFYNQLNTKEGKATAYFLKSFANPGPNLDNLELMYKMNPNSVLLKVMMVREINKLTEWIYTKQYTSFAKIDYLKIEEVQVKSDQVHLREFRNFLMQILAESKIEDQAFYKLLYGHTLFLNNEYDKSYSTLRKITLESLGDKKQRIQLKKSRFLARFYSRPTNSQVDKEVFEFIEWYQEKEADLMNFSTKFPHLLLFIGKGYEQSGDLAKGAMFYNYIDAKLDLVLGKTFAPVALNTSKGQSRLPYYLDYLNKETTIPALNRLIGILGQENPNELEHYLLEGFKENYGSLKDALNAIYHLKGTKYFRANNLRAALNAFQKIPDNSWNTDHPAPNYPRVNKFYDRPKMFVFANNLEICKSDSLFKLGKSEITAKLLKYQDKINSTQEYRDYYYYMLGKAYLSFHHNGRAWWMYRLQRSTDEFDPDPRIDYHENYFGLKKAEHYFQMAMKTSSSVEFQAICCRLAMGCERYNIYFNKVMKAQKFGNDPETIELPPRSDTKYFKILTNKYGHLYDRFTENSRNGVVFTRYYQANDYEVNICPPGESFR